jgi:hypothetical protein
MLATGALALGTAGEILRANGEGVMRKMQFGVTLATVAVLLLAAVTAAVAADRLKPYVLAEQVSGTIDAKIAAVRQDLLDVGFEIAGEIAPYDGAHVFVVTNDALKRYAGGSPLGGFGAAQRVAVTSVGDKVQVSFTNPAWMANVYRMKSELADVSVALRTALGAKEEFGSKEGLTAESLRSYHYMVFMPYFTETVTLAEHASHDEALAKAEAGLAAAKGVRKVARIDVPGTEETLFCVAIAEGDGADAGVMKITDGGALKHTAHLPYELLVSGKKTLMLHGKFRIAQSFPDLTMGTFMKISGAPDGIAKALRDAVK